MEKIIEGIKGEIAHAESLKEQYPKMDSQDVINLLQKIVDLLESESPEPEGECKHRNIHLDGKYFKCDDCDKKIYEAFGSLQARKKS